MNFKNSALFEYSYYTLQCDMYNTVFLLNAFIVEVKKSKRHPNLDANQRQPTLQDNLYIAPAAVGII